MIFKKITILLFSVLMDALAFGQNVCTGLGQNPGSAFPVCGTDTFFQQSVPACGGNAIPTPGCSGLFDLNPYWYRFTCFTSGTLGFLILPNTASDDYDWQLFDITNRNPADVYTDQSMFVACNWTGAPGNTGASASGNKLITCGSNGPPPFESGFSSMPVLTQGHEYLLMISHFSGSDQSGYALSFGGANGGTAIITDSTEPGLASARAICDGEQMTIKLNKKMKCSSLNPDGSDFAITPAFAPIIAAQGVDCSNGFDMDSIVLTLASPVPPGNYSITVKNDLRGINLEDNCGRTISLGQNLSVTVFPLIPTPMDSLTKTGCAPDELELVFSKPMLCSSISADGSDFTVNGTFPVAVISAAGVCSTDGFTKVVRVKLSTAIQRVGTFRITLQNGTDGNTILNECTTPTPAGSFLTFTTADTVNAEFNHTIRFGCKTDTVYYTHNGLNAVNSWQWTFDNNINSSSKDTSLRYTIFGVKTARLIVSNGVCRDTFANNSIILDNELKASFENTAVVCPADGAVFTDKSFNRVVAWNWDFGNGLSSNLQQPAPQLYETTNDNQLRNLPTRLIVTNDLGCRDTLKGKIQVAGNCYIAVPKAFSPNGDGLNELLYPTNAYKARDLYFAIYNRNGNLLFETRNWKVKWDGNYKGNPQDPGTYVWLLNYTHIDTGKTVQQKGTTVLLR